MKKIYRFANRMKQYFLKSRLVFILFVVGGILNTLVFTYCYGNYLPLMANRNSEDFMYREYMAVFRNEPARPLDIEWFRTNELIEACILSDGNGVFSYDAKYPMKQLTGTANFTDAYQVIVSQDSKLNVGDELTFKGHTFEVIGSVRTLQGFTFIPLETFAELGCMNDVRVVYAYSAKHENPSNDRVLALMRNVFSNATSFGGSASQMAISEKKDTQVMFGFVVMNAFLLATAYAFLLYYILDSLRGENVISRLLGASRLGLVSTLLFETVFLALTANLLGVLAHVTLYDVLFVKMNLETHIRYGLGDYALIVLILLVLSVLTAIPILIKMLWLSPIQSRRIAK